MSGGRLSPPPAGLSCKQGRGALLTVTLQTYALATTLHVSHSLCPPLVPRSHLCHQLCPHWPRRKCGCPETCLTALRLAGRPLLPRLSHHRRADDPIYIPHPSHSRSENLAASLGNMGLAVDMAHARDPETKPKTISVPASPAGPFTPPPPQPGHRAPQLCSPDLSPLSTPESP